jgi:hypothetical protein
LHCSAACGLRADANALAFNAGRLAERQRRTEQFKTATDIAA